MAAPAEDRLPQVVKRLAFVFALSVAIGLPGGYFSLQYSHQVEHIEFSVQIRAQSITALVAANPELWVYQLQRMEELLLRLPAKLVDDRLIVHDAAGNPLVTVGVLPPAPVLVRSSPIYDSGRVLGYVEITHSYREVAFGTLAAALLGLLLGVLVYATLLVLPLRALARVMAALVQEKESLHKSEENYRLLFEGNPHPMWVIDEKTLAFLAVNDAAAVKYGWSREEFLRMTLADIRRAEDVPLLLEHLATDNDKNIRIVHDSKHRTKDGTLIDVDISSHVVNFGERRARVVTAYDITEGKRAEASLRESEERFRGLVEQSIAGIYIIQDGRFAYANPRFAEIRGYGSADELIGLDPIPLIAEKDRSAVAENMRLLIAGETRSLSYTFTALRKDGSGVEVGVNSTRATYHGRPAIIGLLQDISEKKRAEEEIGRYVEQLKTAFLSTVEVATIISEMRDPYTAGHERRVALLAVAIGAELGLDARRQEGLRIAGHLHDIGKITIPSEILAKPGKLSAIEFRLIQGHAQASYDVLKGVEWPWPVAQVALQHHERLDGSGYPQGLKGEAILPEARILAVADVVEAMSSHRPYRAGLGIEKALAEIERGRGTAYDPDATDACLRLFREKGYVIPA